MRLIGLAVFGYVAAYVAMLVHEGGHLAMARALRLPVRRVTLGTKEVYRRKRLSVGILPVGSVKPAVTRTDKQELLGALAGPVANLLVAVALAVLTTALPTGNIRLLATIFSAMQAAYFGGPIVGDDGRRIWKVFRRLVHRTR